MVVYFTPLYRASLTGEAIHQLVCLVLLVSGCVFFVPLLDQGDELLPSWCGYSLRVVFALVDGLLDAVPGVVIMTMNGVIAKDYYTTLHRPWGPSPHWDQIIGGGLMFTLSEAVAVPFLVALFVRWVREDERQAHEIDAQLDQAAAARASNGIEPPSTTRPWWETEPGQLAQRRSTRPSPGRYPPAAG
jgi:cytochrome c oxidase assembly factor CtaG